jgi:hypothetical protein
MYEYLLHFSVRAFFWDSQSHLLGNGQAADASPVLGRVLLY